MMKTNESIQTDVQEVIQWETLLNAKEIAVAVNDGIVTLSGTVDTNGDKAVAKNAIANVGGVKGVVDNLKIRKSHHVRKQDLHRTS
jgi:osmotically-inducible protein OsmY